MRARLGSLIPLLLATAASATTIHVPEDEPTITDAVAAASEGDTVLVECGTYLEGAILAASGITLRSETDTDIGAITEVTIAAFQTLEISNHTEQFIIEALRASHVLTVSLVAETDGRVIGHIAFSPVAISDGTQDWYGLGPVSVLPEYQRQGIGKALIREGLAQLRGMHARGCCLVGHPEYYEKFGFENVDGLGLEGVPPEVFFALSFDGNVPQGTVTFHEGFKADGQQ